MIVEFLQKNRFFRKLFITLASPRAKDVASKIQPYLKKGEIILDVGSGSCLIPALLTKQGYSITALDVVNLSFLDNFTPMLYDGNSMPFQKNTFDNALLITVLHHTSNPESIIRETARVSKKMVIVEDIFVNKAHKYLTFFFDSIFNLEFFGHPHSNKSDREWKETFEELGLKLISTEYKSSMIVFKHATYYLEKG